MLLRTIRRQLQPNAAVLTEMPPHVGTPPFEEEPASITTLVKGLRFAELSMDLDKEVRVNLDLTLRLQGRRRERRRPATTRAWTYSAARLLKRNRDRRWCGNLPPSPGLLEPRASGFKES